VNVKEKTNLDIVRQFSNGLKKKGKGVYFNPIK
jgi:hypothetical protein